MTVRQREVYALLREAPSVSKQLAVVDESDPESGRQGPFNALLRNPDLALAVRSLGRAIRADSVVPPSLYELAILLVGRHYGAQLQFWAHAGIAREAGLDDLVAISIAEGRRPEGLRPDEAIVYDFTIELLRDHEVSDETFASMAGRFGELGVVNLIGLISQYTLIARILNVDRHPLPDGVEPLLKPL
jgi:4-carboxymuconolactone decarboxylase